MMSLKRLLQTTRKRADALADLEEVRIAVFGGDDLGHEPNVYDDYDRCIELHAKMRRAMDVLRIS